MKTDVSVIIVSHNTRAHLLRCLDSLREHVHLAHQVVVVDNASQDGSTEAVKSAFPQVSLVRLTDNVGFARANNLGMRESHGGFLLILNSDTEVCPGTVETLADLLASRPEVGVLGPRTIDADGIIQVSFGPALTPVAEWRQRRLVSGVRSRRPSALRRAEALASRQHEPAWVSGSCLLARREALEAVGGFDEGFFLYEEDVDLCRRVRRAGWRILFTPQAVVIHHLGTSMARAPARARFEYHRSHLRYYRKHNGAIATAFLRAWIAGTALAAARRDLQQARRLLALALAKRP